MITQRHLELYREHAGDGDAFVRFAKPEEHALMSHNEWMLIGVLLQDVELLGGELVSDSFAKSAKHRLKELCAFPNMGNRLIFSGQSTVQAQAIRAKKRIGNTNIFTETKLARTGKS